METSVSLLDRLAGTPAEVDWRRLFDLYSPFLREWALRAGVAGADIDDLIQEVMLAVCRDVPKFDRRGRGAFRGWLRAVLTNRMRNHFRQSASRPATSDMLDALESESNGLSQIFDREHDVHVARQVLRRVEPDFTASTWRAFHRLVIENASSTEVASELGLTVNAVLVAKSRVLRRLRDEAAGLL